MKSLLTFLLMASCLFAVLADGNVALTEIMQNKLVFERPSFYAMSDKLTFIGKLDTNTGVVYIAHNQHFWGNGRATNSLVLFDIGYTPLGAYGYIDDIPTLTKDGILLFTYKKEWGNVIDLRNGIPNEIYLDAAGHPFEHFGPP